MSTKPATPRIFKHLLDIQLGDPLLSPGLCNGPMVFFGTCLATNPPAIGTRFELSDYDQQLGRGRIISGKATCIRHHAVKFGDVPQFDFETTEELTFTDPT